YLSTGMVSRARDEARRVLAALRPALASGAPIIGLEPSCTLSMRDEFYSLGLGAEVAQLGKQIFLLEEFLSREAMRGRPLPLPEPPPGAPVKRLLVHGHCHQKAFGVMKAMRKTLSALPGVEFQLADTGCCGMAGGFGLEAEHYAASQQMAEAALLPAVRAAGNETEIIANGFSCRHQIDEGTGRKPRHIALLLRERMGA
ncbi:MAG TPA: FAD-binding oxidoreductase, partial [Azospirillaceae bacterium]|nr:FAD-binding oxidoreductase [Azospirillaceae bacterium]